jgi:hypothetical protein
MELKTKFEPKEKVFLLIGTSAQRGEVDNVTVRVTRGNMAFEQVEANGETFSSEPSEDKAAFKTFEELLKELESRLKKQRT